MIKTKLTWNVKQIQLMFHEKSTLAFDHPIQRQSNQWDLEQKSLLIHSILASFPIGNIYVLRENSDKIDEKNKPIYNFSVLDGKQRLTNVISFLDGEYALSDNLSAVEIDGVEYEIGGLWFSDLEEPVKYELMRFKFEIFSFEDTSNDMVEQIFLRLNNSTPLSKSQISKAKMGTDMAAFMNGLLKSKFINESVNFSASQRKSNDDQKAIIQAMMLLSKEYAEFKLVDFSETSIMNFSESVKNNYSNKQQNILLSAIEYLGDAFPDRNKSLRKISIPIILFIADFAMDHDIKPMYTRKWFEFFIDNDELQAVYKTFCSSGSTKLEKVNGRLRIMMQSFCKYFELEIPEEYWEILISEESDSDALEEIELEEIPEDIEAALLDEASIVIDESEDVDVDEIETTGADIDESELQDITLDSEDSESEQDLIVQKYAEQLAI
ncbi:DUF262 domain-containing protein [[Clostridium] fimetarium]|uniref:GmrSD restriction endonucleases N-terminal domain-containing protein n=1 Tax=[Clostridium] fimetarium TaxID=99656 RepID=A0A1I0QWJ8_9FIRM|nr:DUF262 domain-containing protein [[Clostridium] fimetarium]SEW31828.1 Protein of unknown function DUF262 [[Clostridium] fimetarium]